MHSKAVGDFKGVTYTSKDIERFWTFVHIPVPDFDCCWTWTGSNKRSKGYASFWLNGQNVKASRFSFKLANGWLPKDKQVCHTCDDRLCVNPSHLFLGTNQENINDKVKKGRHSSKLSRDDVIHIRELRDQGTRAKDLALWFHISTSTVYSVCNGHRWQHLS